jgi:hypothetical protein
MERETAAVSLPPAVLAQALLRLIFSLFILKRLSFTSAEKLAAPARERVRPGGETDENVHDRSNLWRETALGLVAPKMPE